MHSLFYEQFVRVVAEEAQRHHLQVDRFHGPGPPPPKRARRVLASWLAAAASRMDREAARRAVA